jgi:two-component system, LytTR family, response regulator
MLSVIIIDDQESCAEIVRGILEKDCPEVSIAAIRHSGKEGIKAIKKFRPDLVILDVEMPGMSGFEMLREIKAPAFDVIFVTAHDKYSIEAIRLHALDYLLKPVLPHELIAAISKVMEKRSEDKLKQINSLLSYIEINKRSLKRVALPLGDGLLFFELAEIIHCESESNYTTLYLTSGQKMVVTKTLKDIETLFEGNDFFRIHNSHLVNMNHIRKYVRGNGGYLVMSNGANIIVARSKKQEFLGHFAHL